MKHACAFTPGNIVGKSRSFLCTGLITALLFACTPGSAPKPNKMLIGKWSHPDIEIKGLPMDQLSREEKAEYRFIMGGMEKMFEDMTIEYFDDRPGSRDSYQTTVITEDSQEKQSDFGEYELLAQGKRLVLHTPDNQSVDIEITQLTPKSHQWRLQYSDMLRLSGEAMEMDQDFPNFAMYLTFKKAKTLEN